MKMIMCGQQRPISACASMLCGQYLCCPLTESLVSEGKTHYTDESKDVQNDQNLLILHILKNTFSPDAIYLLYC